MTIRVEEAEMYVMLASQGPVEKCEARAAAGPAEPVNWDERLGFLLHDVSRMRRTVFDEYMRPLHITRSQWSVLAYVAKHDGLIQSDLAHALKLGKAALGALLDHLEEAAWVRRAADRQDRRAKRVYLTSAVALRVEQMQAHSHAMSERILAGLAPEERQHLEALLHKVKRNLMGLARHGD